MKTIQKLATLFLALTMLLSISFAEEAEIVTLQGVGETLAMDGETTQPTAAVLTLNLTDNTATLELTTETVGMNFYLLASTVSDNPDMALLYMMCAVIGEGTVTEAEDGYLVSFAWETEVMDEATGATENVPFALEIAVKVVDGVYTATVAYLGIVVDVTSAVEE